MENGTLVIETSASDSLNKIGQQDEKMEIPNAAIERFAKFLLQKMQENIGEKQGTEE